jgi:restriction system protein
MMQEDTIRKEVKARKHNISLETEWFTPAGNQRSAPIHVATVSNEYLGKERQLKGKTENEIMGKIQDCVDRWDEQEIRKRVAAAKQDARAEAAQLDAEAKSTLEEMGQILEATLSINDEIDWEAERDTSKYRRFSFAPSPNEPVPVGKPELPPKPGWTWLFKSRLRRWESVCEEAHRTHELEEEKRRNNWQEEVATHLRAKANAERKHKRKQQEFYAKQLNFNNALQEFRKRFEAHDVGAIKEYCSRVLERSQYPDSISVEHSVEFDAESKYVIVNLELPSPAQVPNTAGYKFVPTDSRIVPVPLKKKEGIELYESIVDQIVIRTMHEIFEGCYLDSVVGAIVNGWVTSLVKATGQDKREQVKCIASDRETFESFDLSRVSPAACVIKLSANVGQMAGAER